MNLAKAEDCYFWRLAALEEFFQSLAWLAGQISQTLGTPWMNILCSFAFVAGGGFLRGAQFGNTTPGHGMGSETTERRKRK